MTWPDTLQDLLADADLNTRQGSMNRKVYAAKQIAGAWVIGLNERRLGPVGSGYRAVADEGADINHQAYLEALGWTR